MNKQRRLNDATPEDWDALREKAPAIDKTCIESWMKEAHTISEDVVNNPQHYNNGSVEAIEAIQASMSPIEFRGYLKGNTMKYLWRYDYKGKPLQDLQKASWYLDALKVALEEEV
jgi:hypothetical protein